MFSDHFLRLNDDGTGASAGAVSGSSKHELTITSTVDQTIWVTAHTWDERARPKSNKCKKQTQMHKLTLINGEDEYDWEFTAGASETEPL